jgi:cytoskeletal protein RodZ
MKKNQIIILVIVIVLIFGGIIGWSLVKKQEIPTGEEVTPEEEVEEMFSFTATVLSVDTGNNFLMVKPAEEEKEIKVVLSDTTKLVKIEFPFDPANPPAEATFTPKQTEIEISDFQEGDSVFIKARENIAGKTEFDNVDFVHILP